MEIARYEGRIHDDVTTAAGLCFVVLVDKEREGVGIQLHGAGASFCVNIAPHVARRLAAILIAAANDTIAAEVAL